MWKGMGGHPVEQRMLLERHESLPSLVPSLTKPCHSARHAFILSRKPFNLSVLRIHRSKASSDSTRK